MDEILRFSEVYQVAVENYMLEQEKNIFRTVQKIGIIIYYTLLILQKNKRKTEQKVNQQNNQEKETENNYEKLKRTRTEMFRTWKRN